MRPDNQLSPEPNPAPREPENFAAIYPHLKELGWGGDEFSKRIESVFRNIGISFHEFRDHIEFLKKSFKLFEVSQGNISSQDLKSVPVRFLFVRTFAALLGASMMAMGGVLPEAMNLVRSMLENAVYANFIHKKPEMADIWLKRNDNHKCKQRQRDVFLWGEVLKQISPDQFKEDIRTLYDTCIDYGAHPNPRASLINTTFTNDRVMLSIIHGDPLLIRIVLGFVEKAVILVTAVFRDIYPNTFKMNKLDEQLESLNELCFRLGSETAKEIRKTKLEN